MTSYEIEYQNLDDQDTIDKACEDIHNYLGDKRYQKAIDLIKGENSESFIRMALSFAGIGGYPVTAMIKKYGEKDD